MVRTMTLTMMTIMTTIENGNNTSHSSNSKRNGNFQAIPVTFTIATTGAMIMAMVI